MDQEIKKEFEGLAKIIKEGFDQTATKAELEQMATKDDLKRVEDRLDSIDSNIAKIQSDLEDIRQKLDNISLRTKDDDDAVVKDIFALRRRVDALETQIKQMKLNQG